jgi:membrane protease YdiL (CAAX protease family)
MLLTFVLLALAICAVWVPQFRLAGSVFVPPWALLFLCAMLLGLLTGILSWSALLVLAVLFALGELSRHVIGRSGHIAVMVITGLASLGLALHLFPGFHNPVLLNEVRTGPNAAPFVQYANFDKAAAGLVLLAYFSRRLRSASELRELFAPTAVAAIATAVVLLAIGLAVGHLAFDPKVPSFALAFLAINLLFTCVAEEAFFRGFIQERLASALASRWQWLAVAISSALFGLAHIAGGILFASLATILGFGCAVAYSKTQRVEAPILVHFFFNATHSLVFTYPFLQK